MNSQIWWFVARSSGMVAWTLVTLSVCWGLLLSTRLLARATPGPWLLEVHRFLSMLSVAFTAVHLAALVLDDFVYFGWRELLVPYAYETQAESVAWGIVAFYLLLAVELTSLAIRHLPRRLWRAVHRLSFALYGLATVHGYRAGTDAGHPLFRAVMLASVFFVVFLTVVTVFTRRPGRKGTDAKAQEPPVLADVGV